MRFEIIAARVVVAAIVMFGVIGDAHAQSFFEKLFGGGSAKRVGGPNHERVRRLPQRPLNARQSNFSRHNQRQQQHRSYYGGRYRTMCVRMCDGFYFPISSSVTRSKFSRDANVCRSRCGEDAKLFYHSAYAGNTDKMVNLAGQRYKSFDVAFQYRKKLVKGCRCRPEPWSFAERARHAGYEAEEAYAELTDGTAKVVTNPTIAGIYEEKKKTNSTDTPAAEKVASHEASEEGGKVEGRVAATAVSNSKTAEDGLPFVSMKKRSSWHARNAARRAARQRIKNQKARRQAPHRKRRVSKKASFSLFTPSPGKYRYPGD
ncbi:MAG: DUF2865 domain-containing protein [Hyphomicrobiaceae bacterium]